jgi:hypothetical protein
MTRVVGTQNRSEFILDPAEALRRGAVLDEMLLLTLQPRPRGLQRASHAEFNRQDDLRALEQARLLNQAATPDPIDAFRGSGIGGSSQRLIADRKAEAELTRPAPRSSNLGGGPAP